MFCWITEKGKDSERQLGLVFYYDEALSTRKDISLPPAALFTLKAEAVLRRTQFPPMAIASFRANGYVVYMGVLRNGTHQFEFDTGMGEKKKTFEISFVSLEDSNQKLWEEANERHPKRIPIVEVRSGVETCSFTDRKELENELRPGLNAVKYWIGCLAIEKLILTIAFLCVLSPQKEDRLLKYLLPEDFSFSDDATEVPNVFLMWYPCPRPRSLQSWLSFLYSSTNDEFSSSPLPPLSPLFAGFYHFFIMKFTRSDGEMQALIRFDDEGSTEVFAHIESSSAEEEFNSSFYVEDIASRARLLMAFPSSLLCSFDNIKGIDAWGFSGRDEMRYSFVVPCDEKVLGGNLGPIRSTTGNLESEVKQMVKPKVPKWAQTLSPQVLNDANVNLSSFVDMDVLYDFTIPGLPISSSNSSSQSNNESGEEERRSDDENCHADGTNRSSLEEEKCVEGTVAARIGEGDSNEQAHVESSKSDKKPPGEEGAHNTQNDHQSKNHEDIESAKLLLSPKENDERRSNDGKTPQKGARNTNGGESLDSTRNENVGDIVKHVQSSQKGKTDDCVTTCENVGDIVESCQNIQKEKVDELNNTSEKMRDRAEGKDGKQGAESDKGNDRSEHVGNTVEQGERLEKRKTESSSHRNGKPHSASNERECDREDENRRSILRTIEKFRSSKKSEKP